MTERSGAPFKLDPPGTDTNKTNFYSESRNTDILFKPDEMKSNCGLSREEVRNRHFETCSFSKTRLSGFNFRNCTFERCLFQSTHFVDCEFHDCSFINCNLNKAKFTDVYIDPGFFDECYSRKKDTNLGTWLYHELLRNSQDVHQPQFRDKAHIKFKRWKRYYKKYQVTQKVDVISNALYVVFDKLFDCAGYGITLWRLLICICAIIFIFSNINYFFHSDLIMECSKKESFSYLESIYFTTISMTTVGYGDYTLCKGFGAFWASTQGVLGVLSFALVAAAIYNRIRS